MLLSKSVMKNLEAQAELDKMNRDFTDFSDTCGMCEEGDPGVCMDCRRAVSNKVRKGLRDSMDKVIGTSMTKLRDTVQMYKKNFMDMENVCKRLDIIDKGHNSKFGKDFGVKRTHTLNMPEP